MAEQRVTEADIRGVLAGTYHPGRLRGCDVTDHQRVTDEQLTFWERCKDDRTELDWPGIAQSLIADLRASRAEVERLRAHAAGLEVSLEETRSERDASRAREAEDAATFERIMASETISRRQYLTLHAILDGAPPPTAAEAVASVALEHPEWDMTEERTWEGWSRPPCCTTGTSRPPWEQARDGG